jgi:hypothetical protein
MYANLAGGQIDLGLTPSNVREKVKDFQCSQKEKPKGEPIVVVSQATFPDKPLFKGIVMSVCENGYVEFDTGPAPSTSQN